MNTVLASGPPCHQEFSERSDNFGWKEYAGALLVYLLIAFSIAGPAIFGDGSLIPEGLIDRDPVYQHQGNAAKLRPHEDPTPVVLELARARAFANGLWQGRLETWNPMSGAGAPLWAEQGGPFFPTNAIFYVSPSHATWMAALASRLIVAAMGMFVLARALGLRVQVALFAGAIFEYSGILAAEISYANSSGTYMLPWVLLAAHRLWLRQSSARKTIAYTGLVLGLTLLGGHPGQNLITCVGFGAWFIGAWIQRRPALCESVRAMSMALASILLATLVAGISLVPFLELLLNGHSYKNTEMSDAIWTERLMWTRSVFAAATFVPSLITTARDGVGYNLWPWAAGASIGLIGLTLAALGLQRLRDHWGLVVVGMIGIALVLSPPGTRWIHHLPGLSILLPWYCYPLLVAPACILAGFGLQSVLNDPKPWRLFALAALVLGGTACALFFLPIELARVFDFHRYRNPINAHLAEPLKYGSNLISVAALVVGVGAYWLVFRRWGARAGYFCIASLALLEAAATRIPTIIYERSKGLEVPASAVANRLKASLDGGLWRFAAFPPTELAVPNSSLLFGLRDFRSFSALAVRRHVAFLDLTGPPESDLWRHPQWQYPRSHVAMPLSMASVRYTVWPRNMQIPTQFEAINEFGRETIGALTIYENTSALPRVRVVRNVVYANNELHAFQIMKAMTLQKDFNDWVDTVVLEAPEIKDHGSFGSADKDSQDEIMIESEPDSQTVVIEANLNSEGVLVLADTYFPGWIVKVNGRESKLLPANLMFRGVRLQPGLNRVEFIYRPISVKIGIFASCLGLFITLMLFWRLRSVHSPIK